jgi:hypothetical protein
MFASKGNTSKSGGRSSGAQGTLFFKIPVGEPSHVQDYFLIRVSIAEILVVNILTSEFDIVPCGTDIGNSYPCTWPDGVVVLEAIRIPLVTQSRISIQVEIPPFFPIDPLLDPTLEEKIVMRVALV